MISEDEAKSYLEDRGLKVERFTKAQLRSGKTPDFKVFDNGELVFYCEVKEAEEDKWLDSKLDDAEEWEIVGGLRNDPVFNRLTTHIHKATKQLLAVNPNHETPNVLVIKNNDKHSGFNDLIGVVTGNIYCDDGSRDKIFGSYSEGRLKDDLEHIDLIIWLDEHKPNRPFSITFDENIREKLSSHLNYDYSNFQKLVT